MRLIPSSWYFLIPRKGYLFLSLFVDVLLLVFVVLCESKNNYIWVQSVIFESITLLLLCIFITTRFIGLTLRVLLRVCLVIKFFCTITHTLNNSHTNGLYYPVVIGDVILSSMFMDLWIRYGPHFNTYKRINFDNMKINHIELEEQESNQ